MSTTVWIVNETGFWFVFRSEKADDAIASGTMNEPVAAAELTASDTIADTIMKSPTVDVDTDQISADESKGTEEKEMKSADDGETPATPVVAEISWKNLAGSSEDSPEKPSSVEAVEVTEEKPTDVSDDKADQPSVDASAETEADPAIVTAESEPVAQVEPLGDAGVEKPAEADCGGQGMADFRL